jgi:integration host factor subunit beta
MPTITKKELIEQIAQHTDTKTAIVKTIVQNFLDEIVSELSKNNRIEFRDFGVFEIRERKSRTAQNPKTLEKVKVPLKRAVKFKMGWIMKEEMNKHSVM